MLWILWQLLNPAIWELEDTLITEGGGNDLEIGTLGKKKKTKLPEKCVFYKYYIVTVHAAGTPHLSAWLFS